MLQGKTHTTIASTLLGAFFLLFSASCKEQKSTPSWQQQDTSEQPSPEVADRTKSAEKSTESQSKKTHTPAAKTNHQAPVRFLVYNLKNYLTMPRYINNRQQSTPKPEEEIQALVNLIKKARPDIIGICEIGTPEDLADLQKRLKNVGIDLPYKHQLLDYDPVRTLALISRFPITATAKPEKDDYQVGNTPFRISRGILDVTIQLPNKQIRTLGVHLKSKRPTQAADQALMRRAESGLLRKHINSILNKHPETHLLVYGDFNDTRSTPTLRTTMGRPNSSTGLILLHPKDSRGHLWTHHWGREDIYSRFDFVMISRSLNPCIDKENMRLIDDPEWNKASDHRAILVPIK